MTRYLTASLGVWEAFSGSVDGEHVHVYGPMINVEVTVI
jgi:hypothetical protein